VEKRKGFYDRRRCSVKKGEEKANYPAFERGGGGEEGTTHPSLREERERKGGAEWPITRL